MDCAQVRLIDVNNSTTNRGVTSHRCATTSQRFAIIALAGIIVAGGFIAAVRPFGDATFDTITCKTWKVIDKDGKMRIGATTDANGYASVQWHDKDGKQRITAATFADGNATVSWFDKDEKMRITATTFPDGFSSLAWFDKDIKTRIEAGITAEGKVLLPTKDITPPKKP